MQKLIPPFLVLSLSGALLALEYFHPIGWGQIRENRAMPWDIVLGLGLLVLIGSRMQFKLEGAEIHTFKKPNTIIQTGFYKFSRNPMYVGFFLVVLAGAFYVNTVCALLAPLLFFILADRWYIPFEEVEMKSEHGQIFADYTSNVRRWI